MYAHRAELKKHRDAKRKLSALAESSEPWYIPVFCLGEFLRVVTHPRLFDPPTTPSEAILVIQRLLESPGLSVLRPGTAYPDFLASAVLESGATGNVVFDAQIVAVCRESGVSRLLTEDRDFDRFAGMNILRLGS